MRPYLVPLLPTFHGMENENPYTHIRDFEEVCTTFKEGAIDMEMLKLKAFPLTLKDKAKIWLNSLRPRTIRNWEELQAKFLKKFFSAHKTNNLKRQIYSFASHDSERFYKCWERYMETISACPHHGFDTSLKLPTFHGMENENPYTHIRDFEEVCTTFKEGAIDMEMLKLKSFPLTLKDKAKIWLNSLRLRTIRNWEELQAKFLKKFFSAHKTNNLKRQIYSFASHDSERFYKCWERYMETISACPHHGFDTWMLVNHFYDGMSPAMKKLLETMCGGDFISKNPDEAMDFLNYVAETSKGWDEPNPREVERIKHKVNLRGGIYSLTEDVELKAKLSTLTRRMEELEQRNQQEVRAVTETSMPGQPCFNCQSTNHQGEHCPISPSVRDLMVENANVVGQNRPPTDAQFGNTYNPNWKNHPNLAWKPKPPVYVPPGAHQQQQYGSASQQQQPPTSSLVEQAIMNLSKVVGNFVEEQKTINAQLNQRIENAESSMDKRIDGLHKSLNQKIDTL